MEPIVTITMITILATTTKMIFGELHYVLMLRGLYPVGLHLVVRYL